MKYYAVKKGKQPVIYQTWNDCKNQVNGYRGAEFKAFEEEAAAQAYLQQHRRPFL